MTAFDPSKNYCAACGVQLEPLDNSPVCEVCDEKADAKPEDNESDQPDGSATL